MITFNNIVERFKIFADAHFFVKSFSFGSPDDVDLTKFTSFPLMHLVYTGATYDPGTKTYNLEVYILDVPADKDKKTDRQKEVVSDAEQCAEDIIADIKNGGNIFLFAQDYEVVNATTTPLEEETKNVLSGVLLDLSVSIPYEWDACNAPIDGVTPEGGDEVAYARRGILRMLTQNGATDVLSVRTIKVSNGTLTDEGDGVVSLDTAGAESLNELTDVNITSLTPSQLLQYSGISGNWENITIYLSTLADTKGTPAEGKFLQYTGGFWQPVDLDIELNDLSDVDTSNEATFKILRYDGTNWIADNVPMVGSTGISVLFVNNIATISLDANLADLNNVAALTPSSGQVLTWSGSEWQPSPLPSPPPTVSDIGDLDDVASVRGTSGQILAVNSAGTELEYIDPSDGFISLDYGRIRMGSDVLEGGANAQDFKSQTAQKAQFNTQEDLQGNGITIDTTNNRFTVTTAGHYRLTVNGTFDSTADRSNPTFYFRVNNTTDLLGEGMGYVRSVNDAEGTANVTRVIELEANDYVEVFGRNSANTTGVSLFATQAIFEIERVGAGAAGPTGATGQGVPTGGTANEALVKIDGTDYNTEWAAIYTQRYESDSETLRAGGAETIEVYYSAIADGDGYAESASSDTPATGYDIRRKLYYSEAGFADPDTGTWTQFTAIADNTTFANAKAALLAYLKERTGGTVPISLKQTWEEVAQAPAFTGLLNESYGSGAAAAYSVRRLNGLYTGAAIEVERSSDNTTQDIGFDVDGNLDESALTTFCTGTVCKVRTWYDQSVTGGTGSGNDAVQTSHAEQPIIYTGGAIVKEKGKPAIDTNDHHLLFSSTLSFSSDFTQFLVTKKDLNDSSGGLFMWQTGGSLYGEGYAGQGLPVLSNSSGSQFLISSGLNNAFLMTTANQQKLTFANRRGSTGACALDGSSEKTASASLTGAVSYESILGTTGGGFHSYDGLAQEAIFYASDKSTDRTSIESNIGDYFTQNTPLLDTYTGAAAAYSLRKLRTAYSGSAIRVRRASDNTEQDIGFNVFCELDTVSLASFCSGTDGFVKTWYDQSGNANDATQTTAANQPKIYDGTTGVVTENGKPAVDFNGTSNEFEITTVFSSLGSSDPASVFSVCRSVNQSNDSVVWNFSPDTSNFISAGFHLNGAAVFGARYHPTAFYGGAYSQDQALIGLIKGTTTAHDVYKDGVNFPNSQTTRGDLNKNLIGSVGGARYLDGTVQEVICYASDQSTNRTNIEDNINTFYSIY